MVGPLLSLLRFSHDTAEGEQAVVWTSLALLVAAGATIFLFVEGC